MGYLTLDIIKLKYLLYSEHNFGPLGKPGEP